MAVLTGEGTILKHGSVTVAQRVSIGGPSMSVGSVEKTNLDSTAKEYRPGLFDMGELSLSLQYDPKDSSHQGITTSMTTKAVETWTVQWVDGSTLSGSGFVTAFNPGGMEVEGNVSADVTIKYTGVVTFTPGT
jgi:hypothetical protein